MHSAVRVVNNKAERGGAYLAAAGTLTGNFEGIYAHQDTVVDIVSSKVTGALSGVTILGGSTYLIPCTSIVWVSGEFTAYNADMA